MLKQSNVAYATHNPMTEQQVLDKAAELMEARYIRGETLSDPKTTKEFVKYKLATYEREVFALLLLDTQHRLIEFRELFFGTIDAAFVYPREVIKAALKTNASSVIFAHNHPSGVAEPSQADRRITRQLTDALLLVDIRVLDHIVVGKNCVSFTERGWL